MLNSVNVQCVQNIFLFFFPALKSTYYFCGVSTVLFKDLSAGTVPTLSNLTVQVQYNLLILCLTPCRTYFIQPDGTGTVQFARFMLGTVPYLLYPTWWYRYSTICSFYAGTVPYLIYPTWRYRYSIIRSFYAWHIGMNRLKISESHDTHWLGLIFKEAYQKCWLSMCVRHTVKSYNIAIPAEKNNYLCICLVGSTEWYTQCKCHFKRLYAGGLFNSNKSQFLSCTVLYCPVHTLVDCPFINSLSINLHSK